MDRLVGPAMQWWEGRTPRERRLLATMFVLLAATALWLAVVRPAWDWRAAASQRRQEANAAMAEVRRDLARLESVRPTTRAPSAEGLEPLVRRTAEAAGLDARLAMAADGGLGFRIGSAASGPAFAWLATLEADHGLRICRLGVVENADATLSVEGSLSSEDCGSAPTS